MGNAEPRFCGVPSSSCDGHACGACCGDGGCYGGGGGCGRGGGNCGDCGGCYGGGGGCYGGGGGGGYGRGGGCSYGDGCAYGDGGGGGGGWHGDWQGGREPEGFHDDLGPPSHMRSAGPGLQSLNVPAAQSGGGEGEGDTGTPCGTSEHEELYNKWKEAIVAFAKPVLRGPYERNEITKEEFKQILKKTADKARSPQPPPPVCACARAVDRA